MGKKIIELRNISKHYKKRNKVIKVLDNISITFETGKFYAIMGHSGSGKSTLINIIGMLIRQSDGEYLFNGENVKNYSRNQEAKFRMHNIGLIFQEFYLDNYLKTYENILFPMVINQTLEKNERIDKTKKLLELVDLKDRATHFPKELSGGEKQRVAIARALANNPFVILADEPTGNLDEENEKKVFSILKKLSKEGKCIIVVSHSSEVKSYADKIYRLKNGKITEE